MWSQGMDLLGFLAILVVGYVVVRAISRMAGAALRRAGVDRVRHRASDLASTAIFGGLFLLVLQTAFARFGDNAVSELLADVIAVLPKVLLAVAILVVMSVLAAAARATVLGFITTVPHARTVADVAGGAVAAVGVIAAFGLLGIAPPLVGGLLSAALALIAGCGILAIGVVQPMRQVWQRSENEVIDVAAAERIAGQERARVPSNNGH